MRKAKLTYGLLIAALILFFAGCYSYTRMSRQNLAYLYSDADLHIMPLFKLYHNSPDTSTLFLRVATDQLLYVRDGFMGAFTARLSVSWELVQNYESKSVTDSLTILYVDSVVTDKRKFISDSVKLRIPEGASYILRATATDLNRSRKYTSYIAVNKLNKLSAQNFFIRGTDNLPFFEPFPSRNDSFYINYSDKNGQRLFVKYYKNNFQLAAPPFHNASPKSATIYPDSVFEITLTNGSSPLLSLEKEGIYRILADSSKTESLTLFRFHEDFPEITLPDEMLRSVRFITTRQEFDNMKIMADKKKAVEDFWLNLGGNSDRARQLIKAYYGRVQLANRYFSSYYEGWKTDRGMIYIVYGPPSSVYRNSMTENWIYGEANAFKSLSFLFYKVENPFSENDYILNRSELFRDSWYYAVSNWRR